MCLQSHCPIGKGVFLEASLTYGCKATQIGSMDKVYEELCLFPDDRLQQQSHLLMQETALSHAILPLAQNLFALLTFAEQYGNVVFCAF